jgi:hypothetical protein
MRRRVFVPFAASMLVTPWVARTAIADSRRSQADRDLDPALQRFVALPGTKSFLTKSFCCMLVWAHNAAPSWKVRTLQDNCSTHPHVGIRH